MRAFVLAASIMTAAAFSSHATAQMSVGVSVGDGDRNGFYLAIGHYYRVPERDVVVLRDRHIRDEEMPVVFYFAEHARVRPSVIIALREDGYTWMDIALRYRLHPSLFYDPFFARPNGRGAYRSGRVWGSMRYNDDDFIHFCNVRFLSRHYRYSPEQIMHMRSQHRDYYVIHNTIWREKHNNGRWHSDGRNDRHDNGRKSQNEKHGGSSSDNGPGDVKSGGTSRNDNTETVKSGQGSEPRQQNPPRRRSGSGRD